MNYIALLRKETDSDYGVDFPDFQGCITAGSTLDEAKDMAVEAPDFYIEDMVADGETLPTPSTLETVMADPHNTDAVAFLVEISDTKEKAVRVNVTFPESILKKIDATAKARGMTRSGFLRDAAVKEFEAMG